MTVLTGILYWFFVGLLYFIVGVPYLTVRLVSLCLQHGFDQEVNVLCRFLTFVIIELGINFCVAFYQSRTQKSQAEEKSISDEEERNRLMQNSKLSQTSVQWKQASDAAEQEYNQLRASLWKSLESEKRRKREMIRKFKKMRDAMISEEDSKTKLLSSVKCKATNVAMESEALLSQLKLGKAKLERLTEANKQTMECYAKLAEQVQCAYSHTFQPSTEAAQLVYQDPAAVAYENPDWEYIPNTGGTVYYEYSNGYEQ